MLDVTDATLSRHEWSPQPSGSTIDVQGLLSRHEVIIVTDPSWGTPISSSTSERPPGWLRRAARELAQFAQYQRGWDGGEAPPISPRVLSTVVPLLEALAPMRITPPALVPTVEGGVMVEWHNNGEQLSFELSPTLLWTVFYEDPTQGQSFEAELGREPIPLAQLLARFSRAGL